MDKSTASAQKPPESQRSKIQCTTGLGPNFFWAAQCIPPSLEHKAPGHDGMRCALVLFSEEVWKDFSGLQVSGAPGSTVLPSHRLPADLAEITNSAVAARL